MTPTPKPAGITKRLLDLRYRKEDDQPLDQARYLAVSTGRLEPYLRGLASYPVWSLDGAQTLFSASELKLPTARTELAEARFFRIWTTRLRAQLAGGKRTHLHCGTVLDLLDQLANISTDNPDNHIGILVDPDLPTELTIEPQHLTRIRKLADLLPTVEAFTAIGGEQLLGSAPSPEMCDQLKSIRSELGQLPRFPAQAVLYLSEVTLSGIGGRTWPVLYLLNANRTPIQTEPTIFTTLVELCQQADLPAVVVVDPQQADWRRDLLWTFREQAEPIW